MSDDASDVEEVQRKLAEIQRRKREDFRWSMSRQTAERAIEAIAPPVKTREIKVGSGKRRRRKGKKRLL